MQTAQSENKKSILIVEDDESLQRALADKFMREGFETHTALTGKSGLESALANHPDIILLDIVMPEMDGPTMLEKLRQEGEWGKKARVIFLTNLSQTSDKMLEQIMRDEPVFYLVKSNMLLSGVVARVNESLLT